MSNAISGYSRRVKVVLSAFVPLAAVLAATGPTAYAQDPPAGGAYALAATVSPAPLTAQECAASLRCVEAANPVGGGADDQPLLAQAIAAAGTRVVPAVIEDGTVLTPAQPATVHLGAGTYVLARPLALPPNVNLRGSGITGTTILLAPASWRNFGYTFMIKPSGVSTDGSSNLVSDLTVNGSCAVGAGGPDPAVAPASGCDLGAGPNYGGGIDAGDRWTIQQVRFTNLNYFKLWIAGTRDARAIDNRFDSWGGAGSGPEDNIGGGADATGTVIEHNQFDATIRGNSVDLTNASGAVIRYNTVHATRAYLAVRGVGDYGTMYLEGVTSSTVASNVFYGAHLVLQSNSRYEHTGRNENVTNPRATTVTGNQIVDSFGAGITVTYDDYLDTDGTGHLLRPGGGNVLTGNTITRPTQSGILVVGCVAGAKDAADTVTGNIVHDAGYGGSTSFATGCGTFDTTGIGISIGTGDAVYANTVVDDQAAPTTWYGIHLGARGGRTAPTATVLTDPAGLAAPNTATGVPGGLYRNAAGAPEPATLLAGTRIPAGVTLSWKEAYPMGTTPVGGYRIFRNGISVATLPVGSATVPGTLLTEAQAGFETGIVGWVAAPRTTVSWNPSAGALGAASCAVTATGAGQIGAYGPVVPVAAGATYTSVAAYTAGTAGRRVRTGLVWLDAGGAVISRQLSANAAPADVPGAWVTSSFSAKAPTNAVSAQVFTAVEGAVAGETHLIDRVGLVSGSVTESWTDPSAPVGSVVYQVVAYRSPDGENSAVTAVAVP